MEFTEYGPVPKVPAQGCQPLDMFYTLRTLDEE